MTKAKAKEQKSFWEKNRLSGGYLLKKKLMNIGVSICRFILLFGMCFCFVNGFLYCATT